MTGAGRAFGAVTVLNATAHGRGCALAVQDGVSASWDWTEGDDLHWNGPTDDRLAQACRTRLAAHLGRAAGTRGASANSHSPWPPSRGLKTSSGAATALLRAGANAAGVPLANNDVERLAVAAARDAGVTLTGAFDDQVATVRGGCHHTNNTTLTVLATVAVEPWHVAIWVPDASIPKSALAGLDATWLAAHIEQAEALLRQGDVPGALTHNGAVFLEFYQAMGFPVDAQPAQVALDHGALGAGLSGTGPAVAALFDDPVDLPAVPGGTWQWTRVQEAVA